MLYLVKSFFYFTTLIRYSQELFNWRKKAKTFLHSRIKYFILYIFSIYSNCIYLQEKQNMKKKKNISTHYDMYPEFWTHIYKLGGHHGCFSVFYRRHPFCFCLDSFAIIVINIFINSNCKFFK